MTRKEFASLHGPPWPTSAAKKHLGYWIWWCQAGQRRRWNSL